MPIVTFVSEDLTIEVPVGTSLVEAAAKAGSEFPFACKMGSCGTCRCVITEGHQNVSDLSEAESDLFESLTSVGRHERLGCQLTITGDIHVRA